MSENSSDVRKALESLTGTNKRARFFLRRELGDETQYFEINGHIFDPNPSSEPLSTQCCALSCECPHPANANRWGCTTGIEGFPAREIRVEKEQEWEEEHEWYGDTNE